MCKLYNWLDLGGKGGREGWEEGRVGETEGWEERREGGVGGREGGGDGGVGGREGGKDPLINNGGGGNAVCVNFITVLFVVPPHYYKSSSQTWLNFNLSECSASS